MYEELNFSLSSTYSYFIFAEAPKSILIQRVGDAGQDIIAAALDPSTLCIEQARLDKLKAMQVISATSSSACQTLLPKITENPLN